MGHSIGSLQRKLGILHDAHPIANFHEWWIISYIIGFLKYLYFMEKLVFSDAFNFKLEKTGIYSGLPYLVMALVLQISGHLADYLRSRKICSTTQVRKIFNCGAFICQAIFMAFTAYLITPNTAIVFITIAIGLGGFAWSGFRYELLRFRGSLFRNGNFFLYLQRQLSRHCTEARERADGHRQYLRNFAWNH